MTCPRSLREAQDRSLPLHKLADKYVKVVGLGDVLQHCLPANVPSEDFDHIKL